jgi:hypothetical protein
MKVKLNNVRLAFPKIWHAEQVNGEGEPAFSAAFLFDPKHPCTKELDAAIEQVAKDKWGAKATEVLKQMRAQDRTCKHDGDLKAELDGYPGNFFVNARNKVRPGVFDRDRSPLAEEDGRIYAGCYVNASIDLWAQDNKFGKRINASLGGVQFVKDGEAFAGGGSAGSDEFDDLASEDDEALV